MHLPQSPEAGVSLPGTNTTRLDGWFRAAHTLWIALTILAVVLFVAGMVASADEQLPTCTAAGVACDPVELTAEDVAVMRHLGVPAGAVVASLTVLERVLNMTFFAVGILIFCRRADDWMAILLSLTLVLLGMVVFTSSGNALMRSYPPMSIVVTALGFLAVAAFVVVLFVFPDGRFVPRWTRFLVPPSVLMLLDVYPGQGRLPPLVLVSWLTFAAGSALFAWIYRYRRVSSGVERQQTKWVAFGLLGTVGVVCTWLTMALAFPPDVPGVARTVALLISCLFLITSGMIFPLSVAFAILRYRLYDIDILINRTVVYGMLSACIVGLYVLVVGTLSAVVQSSGNAVIAILASGLAACLVQPLRARLQRNVNRLMYGQRDDPYTVLSQLSHQLRSTLAPTAVLPAIVDGVARGIRSVPL